MTAFAPILGVVCAALLAALPFAAGAQSAFHSPDAVTQGTNTAATITAVEPIVDAGGLTPGTDNTAIVRFRNESGPPITFRDLALFPSSNVSASLVSDRCSSEPLTTGAQCAVVIAIKGVRSGAFRIEVLARHTGASRLVTATVSGSVEPFADSASLSTEITITPAALDLGKLEASRPILRSVTLANTTSTDITVNDLFIDAPEASGLSLQSDCRTLRAGEACIATIVWSPATPGPASGTLVVTHSGATGTATALITGEFQPATTDTAKRFPEPLPGKGLLVAGEEMIAFGDEIAARSSVTVPLVNIGDAPLALQSITLSGSQQGLALIATGCRDALVLAPTEACPLTVTWSPSKAGAVIDDVRITHTGARGVLVLPIRGIAIAAVPLDGKPVVDLTSNETDAGTQSGTGTTRPEAGSPKSRPVLDGYVVTSLARTTAVVAGPGGRRIVRDGQTIRLAGRLWTVAVTGEGVALTNGPNRATLVFDRSIASAAKSR